jgi:uncharacterized protein YjbI with pentapeptide repeats
VLRGANLTGAKLSFLGEDGFYVTDLSHADLANAKLQSADLSRAIITAAKFTGARYDPLTRWPSGFDPTAHGALLVR